jgi:hypothetical protein
MFGMRHGLSIVDLAKSPPLDLGDVQVRVHAKVKVWDGTHPSPWPMKGCHMEFDSQGGTLVPSGVRCVPVG